MEDRAVAVVTDNLSFDSSYQAFERPPDYQSLYSLIPRGLRRFFFAAATALKPVNDQYNLFLTATLPENFAYILMRMNLQLTVDRAADFELDTELRMFNHIPSQPVGTSELVMVTAPLFVGTGDPRRVLTNVQQSISQFAGPVWSIHGGSITFRIAMTNINATAAAAGFLIAHCEFLEYDLTQAQRYYINTPYPVMQR